MLYYIVSVLDILFICLGNFLTKFLKTVYFCFYFPSHL